MKRKRSCPATGRAQHRPFLSLASCRLATASLQQQQVQPFTTQDPTVNVCLFYLHYFHSCQCAESGKSTNFKKHCLPINFKWPFNLHVNVNCMKAHSTRRESERSHTEALVSQNHRVKKNKQTKKNYPQIHKYRRAEKNLRHQKKIELKFMLIG